MGKLTTTILCFLAAASVVAADIKGTRTEQGKVTTGIGNKDVPLLRSTIDVGGSGEAIFQEVCGTVKATSPGTSRR